MQQIEELSIHEANYNLFPNHSKQKTMKYRIGNLDTILKNKEFEVFIHGCNTYGVMGAGVAGLVKTHFPDCYSKYKQELTEDERWQGGDIIATPISGEDNRIILNALTQEKPGPNGSYDFIDSCFDKVARLYNFKEIIFPLIGCGIAGLNWNIVQVIIDERLKGLNYQCIVRPQDVINYKLPVNLGSWKA
jgi:O-acetyl-ADP-ribose deacetylase (regulator of RNase III)